MYTNEVMDELDLSKDLLIEKKSIEVGNIFKLGTKFSEPLGLTYKDKEGKKLPVVMGCYGIGPSRLMGTVAEVLADDKGIVWPKEIAPFSVHIIRIGDDEDVVSKTDTLYELLTKNNIDTLYDDRDLRAGEKFADSDLLGIPIRIIVSRNTLKENKYEISERKTGAKYMQTESEILEELLQLC